MSGTFTGERAATAVVIMKKMSSTRLMSISGIMSTSSSSSSNRRPMSISTGWSRSAASAGAGPEQEVGQERVVPDPRPRLLGAGRADLVVGGDAALPGPPGHDPVGDAPVDGVGGDEPDVEALRRGHPGPRLLSGRPGVLD